MAENTCKQLPVAANHAQSGRFAPTAVHAWTSNFAWVSRLVDPPATEWQNGYLMTRLKLDMKGTGKLYQRYACPPQRFWPHQTDCWRQRPQCPESQEDSQRDLECPSKSQHRRTSPPKLLVSDIIKALTRVSLKNAHLPAQILRNKSHKPLSHSRKKSMAKLLNRSSTM